MNRYFFLPIVASIIFASANGQVGSGECRDSQGEGYDQAMFIGVDAAECATATYCGRVQVRGYHTLLASSGGLDTCVCLFDSGYFTPDSLPSDMSSNPKFSEPLSDFGNLGVGEIISSTGLPPSMSCYINPSFVLASIQGDPTIVGLNGQKFKFDGRDGAWYANLATEKFFWNMQFKKFGMCPEEENMFVSAVSFVFKESASSIFIRTTQEVDPECYDPHSTCLGGGNLQISLDGGKTFNAKAGDFGFAPGSRVIAHNTYGSCSRKWFDFDVSALEESNEKIRGGHSRRMQTLEQKSPIEYVGSEKGSMLDPLKCDKWIEDRITLDDLFQQNGLWSTIHIVTPFVSFHVEFRRNNPEKVEDTCDFQSLDTWITNVSPGLAEQTWEGVLGETRFQKHDEEGQKVTTDRFKVLAGKNDSDYEVDGPFGTNFVAFQKDTFNFEDRASLMSRALESNTSF